VPKEDISVKCFPKDSSIQIEFERKQPDENPWKNLSNRPWMVPKYGLHKRTIRLVKEVDSSNLKAACANGVLTITIPLVKPAAEESIDIAVE